MRKYISNISRLVLERTGYGLLRPGDLDRLAAQRTPNLRSRLQHLVTHPPVRGRPVIALTRLPAREEPDQQATARRLLDAYRRAADEQPRRAFEESGKDLWSELVRNELGELTRIIEDDDHAALGRYLQHFGERQAWFGGLSFTIDAYGYDEAHGDPFVALTYLDRLVCLAEALGVLPIEHPEHGRWGQNLYADPATLAEGVGDALGISIVPPEGAVPVCGIRAGEGVYHYRHLNAVYTAHLLSLIAPAGSSIAEYGGGLGAVALYARRLGFPDYTLFDLPITNLFAAHFLIRALGHDAVSLLGEPSRPDTVKCLPYWHCADAPLKSFEVSMNQDSFPEVRAALVRRFFREIRRTTRGAFLSINHEAESDMTDTEHQLNVSAMLRGESGYTRISRKRYWLREGYAEEVYRIAA